MFGRLPGLIGKGGRSATNEADLQARFRDAHELDEPGTGALPVLLAEIERAALELYDLHGLPTQPGHYGRSPRAKQWKFIDASLNAEERWALVLANPKWRFAALEDLGALSTSISPDLATASGLLRRCADLKSRAAAGRLATPEEAEAAIRLGSDWRLVESQLARQRSGRLRLTPPQRRARRTGDASQASGARDS